MQYKEGTQNKIIAYVQQDFAPAHPGIIASEHYDYSQTVWVKIPPRVPPHTPFLSLTSTLTFVTQLETKVGADGIDNLCSIIVENALKERSKEIINILTEMGERDSYVLISVPLLRAFFIYFYKYQPSSFYVASICSSVLPVAAF